jgi:WD40 repeat protein
VSTGETIQTLNVPNGTYIYSVLPFDNDYLVAGGNYPRDIMIYNLSSGSMLYSLQGHTDDINDIIPLIDSPDLLESGSNDNTVRIWNLTVNSCKFLLEGHGNSIYSLKQINSEILASGSHDYTIKLWNIPNGQLIRTLEGHTDRIYWSLDLFVYDNSRGLSLLASDSRDHTVKFWNRTTGFGLEKWLAQYTLILTLVRWLLFMIFKKWI